MTIDRSHRDSDRAYADHSPLVALASAASARLRAWAAASRLARIAASLETTFGAAARISLLAGMLRTLAHYVRHSYCYRWLTAEPDPNVIVVDLRETHTVGPFIALLDRVQPSVASAWSTSTLHRIAARLAPNRELFARSRTVRLLVAALEPPEPPTEVRDVSAEKNDPQED